ncbi:MAG: glycosyltransferase family 2 protein [Bacteroidaceae bacterium]|nr:glycosyltransferase family 2 protein [Bacteroidaceae bacterium]
MTLFIIINWNGADDTIACLRSLERAEGDFRVVVADNGSSDDSRERITDFLATLALKAELLPLEKNYGFAVGNNKAIAYARKYNPDSYLLLNNDTEVEPDFFLKLKAYRDSHPECKIIGPLINYWSEKERIWSCGGKLIFGSRKACFRNTLVSDLPERTPYPVSFVSGCALMADSSLIDKDGKLLTERFFFGEEDYEFALRMRRQGEKMAIVRDSVIYHKVGSTAKKASNASLGRDYMYYLGRLIVAREYYSPLQFALIRLLTTKKSKGYFMVDGLNERQARMLAARLAKDACTKDGITKDDFQMMLHDGTYFDFLNEGDE